MLGALLSLGFLLAAQAQAATLIVTNANDDDSAGSLRAVLASAASGDTVVFSNSAANGAVNFYDGAPHTITLRGTNGFANGLYMDLARSVTITGPGADKLTIDANYAGQIFRVESTATVGLSGFTFARGLISSGSGTGGGAIGSNGTLSISNCTFQNNRGGAIYVGAGAVTSRNNLYTGNLGDPFAGAIFLGGGGTLNSTADTYTGNKASAGGAIYQEGGSATFTGCTIAGNKARDGGALSFSYGANTTLIDCTVSGNSTGFDSGGINVDSSRLNLISTTISGNYAIGQNGVSGGIGIDNASIVNATNCIISGNTGNYTSDVYGPLTSNHCLIGGDPTTILSGTVGSIGPDFYNVTGTGFIPNLANNGGPTQTIALVPNSPAIDAGDPAFNLASLPYDQRGYQRVVNGRIDIGAVEMPPPPVITLAGANPMTVECHTPFIEPGASATDDGTGNVPVTVTGSVDTNTWGVYTLTYDAVNVFGSHAPSVTRTVNVVDTTAPVITLNGANPISVEAGSTFTDPGAMASDTCAGSLTDRIVRTGSVNSNVPGTYTLTYNVQDPSHNPATSVSRTVKVVDTTNPVIGSVTAPAPAPTNSNCQAAVPNVLAGVSATDVTAVTLSQNPLAGTLVGVGPTVITITATDTSNNSSSKTVTFTVNAVPSYVVSIAPATVKQGGQLALSTTSSNCGTSAVQLSLQATLVEPKSRTLIGTVPVTLAAGQHGTSTMQITVPKSTKLGAYTLTLDVYLGSTKIGTSSAQVTVTK